MVLSGSKDSALVLGMCPGLVGEQESCPRDHPARPGRQCRAGVLAGGDSAGKEYRPTVGERERPRQKPQRFGSSAKMTSRFTPLGDQAVGAPEHRAAGLVLRAHHDEDENACAPEVVDQ